MKFVRFFLCVSFLKIYVAAANHHSNERKDFLEGFSLASSTDYLSKRFKFDVKNISLSAYIKSYNSDNRTIFALRSMDNSTIIKVVHAGGSIETIQNEKYPLSSIVYESVNFIKFRLNISNVELRQFSFDGKEERSFNSVQEMELFIGDPTTDGLSFNGTIAGLSVSEWETEHPSHYSQFDCLDPTEHTYEDLKKWTYGESAVLSKNESYFNLCNSQFDILVLNNNDIKGTPKSVCRIFGGREVSFKELQSYLEEFLPFVEEKCQSPSNKSEIFIWTDDCELMNLREGKRAVERSCAPIHACFLCLYKKTESFTIRSREVSSVAAYLFGSKSYQIYEKGETKTNPDHLFLDGNSTSISYIKKNWVLQSLKHNDQWILSNAALPFGSQKWYSMNKNISEVLMISNCDGNACNDGECIKTQTYCDGERDCQDGSDEICPFFPFHAQADKEKFGPPRSRDVRHLQEIMKYSIKITGMGEVKLSSSNFKLDLYVNLRWVYEDFIIESTAPFECNMLPWFPEIQIAVGCETGLIVNRSIRAMFCKTTTLDKYRSGFERQKLSGRTQFDQVTTFQLEVPCIFDFRLFPFATQECKFCLWMQNFDPNISFEFVPLNRDIVDPSSDIYNLGDFQLGTPTHDVIKNTSIIVIIPLNNKVYHYILRTYIPSGLILLVSYITLYFHLNSFAERVSVTLTALLAMVFLFIETSSDNIATSYILYIDIWFLVMMVLCVALVCFNCMIHYSSWKEEERTERKAKDAEEGQENGKYAEPPRSFKKHESGIRKSISIFQENARKRKERKINMIGRITFPVVLLFFLIIYFGRAIFH